MAVDFVGSIEKIVSSVLLQEENMNHLGSLVRKDPFYH